MSDEQTAWAERRVTELREMDVTDAYKESVLSQLMSKLEQRLYWYDNVPEDEDIIRSVKQMRVYWRELERLGFHCKSTWASIAEAVAAEREVLLEVFIPIYDLMYVKEGLDWSCRICGGYNYTKETVAHGMTCPMGKAQVAIRARTGEGDQG